MSGFFLDSYNASDNTKLGDGPLVSVSRYQQTRRLSRADSWGADLVASEKRLQYTHATPASRVVDAKRLIRCHLTTAQGTRELGAGIIDTLGIEASEYGMDIGGNDLSILLGNPTVHELELGAPGSPITVKAAVDAISPYRHTSFASFDTTTYLSTGTTANGNTAVTSVTNISNFSVGDPIIGAGIPNGTYVNSVFPDTNTIGLSAAATATASGVTLHTNQIEHTFAGESVLAALVWLADTVNESWRREGDTIVWLYRTQEAARDGDGNKLYAVVEVDPVAVLSNPTALVITKLTFQRDSRNVFNRIFPYGAGSGSARENIGGVTTPLPSGYSYGETVIGAKHYFYIQHDASVFDDGPIERNVSFREIVSPTEIARAGLTNLQQNVAPLDTIIVELAKVEVEIRPGQTVYLEYHDVIDGYRPLDLQGNYLVQQVQEDLTVDATYAVALQLGSSRRWPVTTSSRLAQLAADVDALSSYGQPSV